MLKITWLGHSTFEIAGTRRVMVDPFLTENPKSPKGVDDLGALDVVAITHDHFDHIADAPAVLKKTGATAVATFEIATDLAQKHGVKAEGGNLGGSITVDGVTCHFVPAWHTCGLGGTPAGFVIELDGHRVWHMGDTCLYSDMALYAKIFRPEVLMVPIGDRFTMGPKSAAMAVGLVKPKVAIPMHYNTWPPIEQDPETFRALCKEESPETEIVILEPGQVYELGAWSA